MKKCTLIFPRRNGTIGLALKKQDIHTSSKSLKESSNTWNGWGGKMDWYDLGCISITACREFWQESRAICFPWGLKPAAQIYFHWPGDKRGEATMHVYIYFLDFWIGKIKEGQEMGPPVFFQPADIPYDCMMKGDRVFLPRLIQGEMFVANLFFDQKDERGLPVMEIFLPIPWYTQFYVCFMMWWKQIF